MSGRRDPMRPGTWPAWARWSVGAVAFLVAFLLAARLAQPQVQPADGGEFQLVLRDLGVAHPPGYPLYTMVGHVFGRLATVPAVASMLGAPARAVPGNGLDADSWTWATNLFSTLLALSTLALSIALGRRLARSAAAGLAAAAVLALTPTFVTQSAVANIRMPTAFLATLLLTLCVRWLDVRTAARAAAGEAPDEVGGGLARATGGLDRGLAHVAGGVDWGLARAAEGVDWGLARATRSVKRGLARAAGGVDWGLARATGGVDWGLAAVILVAGLAVGHHTSLVPVAGLVALAVLSRRPAFRRNPRTLAACVLAFLLSLLPILYLPIRDAAGAPYATGSLDTVRGVLEHVTGYGFRGDALYVRGVPELTDRWLVLWNILTIQFGLGLLTVAGVGMVWLVLQRGAAGLLVGSSAAAVAALAMTYRAPQTMEYLLPAYVCVALSVGVGAVAIARVAERAVGHRWGRPDLQGHGRDDGRPESRGDGRGDDRSGDRGDDRPDRRVDARPDRRGDGHDHGHRRVFGRGQGDGHVFRWGRGRRATAVGPAEAAPWYGGLALVLVVLTHPNASFERLRSQLTAHPATDVTRVLQADCLPDGGVVLAGWHHATSLTYAATHIAPRPDVRIGYVFPEGAEPIGETWRRRVDEAQGAVIATNRTREMIDGRIALWPIDGSPFFATSPGPCGPDSNVVPMDVVFDDTVRLDDIAIRGLSITASFHALQAVTETLTIVAQVVDKHSGAVLGQTDHAHAGARWSDKRGLVDRLRIVPYRSAPGGEAYAVIGVYRTTPAGPQRLGSSLGEAVSVGEVVLSPAPRDSASDTKAVPFGSAMSLTGSRVVRDAGMLLVDLDWLALPEASQSDYVVSVQAHGDGWRVQHDGVPALGAIPTLKWFPGMTVHDRHRIELPDGLAVDASYTVTVGVYDGFTMEPLQVTDAARVRAGEGQAAVIHRAP